MSSKGGGFCKGSWQFIPAALLVAGLSAPLYAQDSDVRVSAEDLIVTSRYMYGTPPETQDCSDDADDSDIVVCRKVQDDSEFRVKSSREMDALSREALQDGKPRAPDVGGDGIFQGKATMGGGCGILQECPPEPVYEIDFNLLPSAPEGSDADRIAKGEKPAS